VVVRLLFDLFIRALINLDNIISTVLLLLESLKSTALSVTDTKDGEIVVRIVLLLKISLE
jgi:hypothetical protein